MTPYMLACLYVISSSIRMEEAGRQELSCLFVCFCVPRAWPLVNWPFTFTLALHCLIRSLEGHTLGLGFLHLSVVISKEGSTATPPASAVMEGTRSS